MVYVKHPKANFACTGSPLSALGGGTCLKNQPHIFLKVWSTLLTQQQQQHQQQQQQQDEITGGLGDGEDKGC